MLFNSYEFIFLFLPVCFIVFFFAARHGREVAVVWLVLASLFFYGWWNPVYLVLILISMIVNFMFGEILSDALKKERRRRKKLYLMAGVIFNLGILAYFKYAGFIVDNINLASGSSFSLGDIALPLAISFFTFQQIAYLVDASKGITQEYSFSHYALFVTFFPQLIAGPIVHHKEMLPQFMQRKTLKPHLENIAVGLTIFFIGLFKKAVLADGVAQYASPVFDAAAGGATLTFFEAWGGALAYTMQLYFDFSGYSDMAIGLGRMLGFEILENFNFPYIAKSIREFWRRWHISLTNWFRDYLYIPLGGNRKNQARTYINLIIVFLLTGLWHGASWGFVAWGLLHGTFMVIERVGFEKVLNKFWSPLQHIYTLIVVLLAWVLFRADDFSHALGFYKAMFSFNSIQLNRDVLDIFLNNQVYLLFMIALISSTRLWIVIYHKGKQILPNLSGVKQHIVHFSFTILVLVFIAGSMLFSTIYLIANTYNPFIYFRF